MTERHEQRPMALPSRGYAERLEILVTPQVDLVELSRRESEQIEWKENVADIDDVVRTLSAFANDLANLGGGYVVCGAREDKDLHGFPTLVRSGLSSSRLREIEGKVLTRCRERVSPSIAPLVQELPASVESGRILVFIQPATGHAHTFRGRDEGARHYVRVSRSTIEAKNGLLRDLLVRKGELEPWDRRACAGATINDLDLLALRDALQRMGMFAPDRGVDPILSDTEQIHPLVPPLCWREPLQGTLRPRNFAVLLFGRNTQRFVPGAFSIFSIYPGEDRSIDHAERHEIAGNLLEQARRLTELLDVQSYTAFDKNDARAPNTIKYPKRALYEALGNALSHRDYEISDPTRITVFQDRIEILSPGSLPLGVDPAAFRQGRSGPKWRNQTLAWFFPRLQIAQAEGQGIPTILRVMREEGCPPPILESDATRVLCLLPAHPRHALLSELREVERALALGELREGQRRIRAVIDRDPLNYRALQVFAEIQKALREPEPIVEWLAHHQEQVEETPAAVRLALAEALLAEPHPSDTARNLARAIFKSAARGRLGEREIRRATIAMLRAGHLREALDLIDESIEKHPEWEASLRQLRGDTLIHFAKRCRHNAKRSDTATEIRRRAWSEFHAYLEEARRELDVSLSRNVDPGLTKQIQQNVDYLERLRRENPPRRGRRR